MASDVNIVRERLLQNAHTTRKRRNIEIVWDALVTIRGSDRPNYSLANVGKHVEALGGPKTQSLRNAGGRDFKELIDAFADAAGSAGKSSNERNRTPLEAELARIPNLAVQTSIRMVIEENRRLKRENDVLRAEFKSLAVDDTRAEAADVRTSRESALIGVLVPPATSMSSLAIQTLEQFLSEEWLENHGIAPAPDGSLLHAWFGNALIAPPGFIDALRAVLAADVQGEALS